MPAVYTRNTRSSALSLAHHSQPLPIIPLRLIPLLAKTSPVLPNLPARRTAQTTAAAFQEARPRHGRDKSCGAGGEERRGREKKNEGLVRARTESVQMPRDPLVHTRTQEDFCCAGAMNQ